MRATVSAGAPATALVPAAPLTHARIFIVMDSVCFRPPFSHGGTETQLSMLALELERHGAQVTCVARQCLVPTVSAAVPRAPRTHYVPPRGGVRGSGWAALGPNLRFIANTARLMVRARHRYDAMIVSGFRQLALPLGLIARLLGKRCIVRIEAAWDLDDQLTPESSARIGPLGRLVVRLAVRASRRLAFAFAHDIVAFSPALRGGLAASGAPARKIRLLPNGLDSARFAPVSVHRRQQLRSELGLPAGRRIYLYAGRICRSKGVLDLLRVWERLAERDDLFLVLAGGGDSHDSCVPEVARFVADHPHATATVGPVAHVEDYLQAADVFISLSHRESFGLSLLEAIAVGLPCVTTDVGIAGAVVRHHGSGALLPPHTSPEQVLAEIGWIESHREGLSRSVARARELVVRRYGISKVAQRYAELCEAREIRPR